MFQDELQKITVVGVYICFLLIIRCTESCFKETKKLWEKLAATPIVTSQTYKNVLGAN